MTYDIPPGIEQQALACFTAMYQRGLKAPLRTAAKQVAVVVLAKWSDNNAKAQRVLSNRLITHIFDIEGISCDAQHKYFETTDAKPEEYAVRTA